MRVVIRAAAAEGQDESRLGVEHRFDVDARPAADLDQLAGGDHIDDFRRVEEGEAVHADQVVEQAEFVQLRDVARPQRDHIARRDFDHLRAVVAVGRGRAAFDQHVAESVAGGRAGPGRRHIDHFVIVVILDLPALRDIPARLYRGNNRPADRSR